MKMCKSCKPIDSCLFLYMPLILDINQLHYQSHSLYTYLGTSPIISLPWEKHMRSELRAKIRLLEMPVIQAMIWIVDNFDRYSDPHFDNGHFKDWILFNLSNTRLVHYSDGLNYVISLHLCYINPRYSSFYFSEWLDAFVRRIKIYSQTVLIIS